MFRIHSIAFFLTITRVSGNANWVLQRLDKARFPDAQCLDGSQGAFYVSPGSGANASNFVIHLQGGGWCTSLAGCAARAAGQDAYAGQPSIGGTGSWASSGCPPPAGSLAPVCVADGGDGGALNDADAVNPDLAGYTKVFVGYCDGSSFASDVAVPVVVNATTTVFFRGRRILDAVLETLVSDHGLAAAPRVLLKGCSAGGMAVFLHADRIGAWLRARNPAVNYAAFPGAGTILYMRNYNGGYTLDPQLEWMWTAGNMSGSGNQACVAAASASPHMCFYPQVNLPFTKTPLFVSNSLADLAQVRLRL